MRMTRTLHIVCILLVGWSVAPGHAAPKAVLWERWLAHDPDSSATIDHDDWTRLLTIYLAGNADGINRFAYGRVTETDKRALLGYIDRLTATPISKYNRDEQRAYWINLYNALTIKLILDYYPVASITKISISPGLFAFGPWDKKLITVEGERLSLNDIEHRILRPIWQDPRIHYAINCASLGCPNLQEQAFTTANAATLLTEGAIEFINHERGASITAGRLIVSSIYEWFKEDFGNNDSGVIEHLKQYAKPDLAASLESATRIARDNYDWSLNDSDS